MDFTMLSRKRKNPMHDYLQSLSIPLEKRQKTEQFYDNLRTFYRRKWGFPVKSPHVNGKEFDLFELYEIVVSLGGWQKVTSFDRWNEVLHKLSVDENIQMSEYAVRSIYLKYLSRFEQNENDGDIVDEHENELLGGRSNRLKGISTMACYYEPPFSNMHKTSVSSTVPNFHKLIYSLMSGLSNEVAFGLNVITIMSHPGPFVLNFTNSLNLINVLVALLGININQDDSSTSKLNVCCIESAGYNMTEFWMNAGIEEPELNSYVNNYENIEAPQSDIFDSIKLDKFDLNKPLHWRVFNVLGIFNNLSFEEFNFKPMGENKALIRFLLICCNCRYQTLKKHAYETLSNVAKFINLNSLGRTISTNVLFKTIQNGLHSNDKFKLLRSMELIAGLSQNAINETLICEFLDKSQAIARIFTLLTLKDILICVVSLETLLQISELGKTSCELIGAHNVSINLLVGMLTTDAASFGQAGLFGIKVVEIRGNSMKPYVNPNKKNLSSQIQTPPNPPIHQLYQTPIPPQLQTAAIPEAAADSSICRQTISSKIYQQQQQQSHHILSSPPNNNYVNEYMCEWMMMALDDDEEIEPCSRFFQSTSQLLYHIYNDHLKTLVQSHSSSKKPDDICMIRCRWPMCDNTPRTLWSMTTHLQDVHCVEQNLDASLRRRCELGFDEYTNQIRQHYERNRERERQPGYSPFAAFEAIRRHAFVNLKKEITDDSEGPVTKNLRLTSALILRNVCKYSVSGRRKLRKHESFISWLSLSKMESSRILAQCLAEMVAHSSLEVDQQALLLNESQN